jgi:hypothetical protein
MTDRHHRHAAPRTGARQRGLGLLSTVLVVAALVSVAIVALRTAPTVIEYLAAKRAIHKVAELRSRTAAEITKAFDDLAAVDDIGSIAGRDLRIERGAAGATISFSYEKRIALAGPVSLLIVYQASTASAD